MTKNNVYALIFAIVMAILLSFTCIVSTSAIKKYDAYADLATAHQIIIARKQIGIIRLQHKQITYLTAYCVNNKESKSLDTLASCKKEAHKILGLPENMTSTRNLALSPLPASIIYTPSKDK